MRGRSVLLINVILSVLVSIMFLAFLDGRLIGFKFSWLIILFAFIVLFFLFMSLVYAIRVIFVYRVFTTAGNIEKALLIWPFLQLLFWGFLLLQ